MQPANYKIWQGKPLLRQKKKRMELRMTEALTQEDILTWARTVWGESRGESPQGQLAVAFVPYNRAQISGQSVATECRKSYQFSCWNARDPNRAYMLRLDANDLHAFLALIDQVLAGVEDPSQGATFYHVRGISPAWTYGQMPCARIGNHIFYRGITPY